MIKLSKRLEAISSLIPYNSTIIDIGCDHGLLDIFLCQNNQCKKIIASDINENALNNAKNNIKKYNLEKKIETRLGNGLDTLKEKDDINTIVISGMGAHTVINIIKNHKNKIKNIDTIVIQSNTKLELLRKEITKLNYKIEDELIIEDSKKIYIIIKFIKGKRKYTKRELYFGPILIKKNLKLFQKKANEDLNILKNIYNKLPKKRFVEKYKTKKKIDMYKEFI